MRSVDAARVVSLQEAQRKELESFATSRSLPHALVVRPKLVLMAATGAPTQSICTDLRLSRQTVGKWRGRFVRHGIEGLYDEYRPGRPRSVDDEQVAHGATQWSCREMAKATGLSKSTVQRVWSAFGLKPHRQRSFKLSTDPFLAEKLRETAGLCPDPPENAAVLCVDE